MRIVEVAAESVPLVKVGGLADVVDGLSRALHRLGHRLDRILPGYRRHLPDLHTLPARKVEGFVFRYTPGETGTLWFLDAPALFDRKGIYGEQGKGYPDNWKRFGLFSRAAAALIQTLEPTPDVVHVHDWHTATVPVFLGSEVLSILTLHNAAYQERLTADRAALLGLPYDPGDPFTHSLLAQGLRAATWIVPVSPTYARELLEEGTDHGLAPLLRPLRERIHGILNGLDTERWDPRNDPALPVAYGISTLEEGKRAAARTLRQELDLPSAGPLLGMVARITRQKGQDLLPALLPILRTHNAILVILGTGDGLLEDRLQRLANLDPRYIRFIRAFRDDLARRIYAASDWFLMPSRYEPCGLAQMIAFRYGTPVVAHRTGGLADTVVDLHADPSRANGFLFWPFGAEPFRVAVDEALTLQKEQPEAYARLRMQAMQTPVSWEGAARAYVELMQARQEVHP
jgi:starch synthase